MENNDRIVRLILQHYPNAKAIYLFGTYGTPDERPDSDVDIAVLLSPDESRTAGSLTTSPAQRALATVLGKDVDLINLRKAPTVLQKEVVATERRIYTAKGSGKGGQSVPGRLKAGTRRFVTIRNTCEPASSKYLNELGQIPYFHSVNE